MIPKECKRLAEVEFPIAVVSKHAARESIEGFISAIGGEISQLKAELLCDNTRLFISWQNASDSSRVTPIAVELLPRS